MPQRNFDFDRVYSRRQTDSVKWRRFADDVLPLWVADMDFASPPEVITAIQERISHPLFGYADDDDELRHLICDWLTRRYQWSVSPEQIMFTCGVVNSMNWVAQALLQPGEGVAFQTPVYSPFFKLPLNVGCPWVEIPLIVGNDRYEIDFDMFEKCVAQEVRLFLLCNPHNPVGRVFSSAELEQLAEICMRNNIIICSDEIHCDLVYSGNRHIPFASLSAELAQKTITLMAPSKTFNIPGLNLSFVVVQNSNLRERLKKGRRGVVGLPNLLACAAARGAYQHGESWLIDLLVYLEGNRKNLMDFLRTSIPAVTMFQPQGTYLAWLDVRQLSVPVSACAFFLKEARVALNDGRDYGIVGEGFVRLNFGCPRSILQEALQRMQNALNSL